MATDDGLTDRFRELRAWLEASLELTLVAFE
jgi:hypothetical protein